MTGGSYAFKPITYNSDDGRVLYVNAPAWKGELKAVPAAQRISVAEIRSMIEEVGDLVWLVPEAGPDDKAELYARLVL
ncbi:hypothetical protein [Nonomuraea jabiensis]|uniref:hypothetical protein n=1 Tax=Nonomuraea jabiensis TaxID=882448 RepID=UPI003678C9D0